MEPVHTLNLCVLDEARIHDAGGKGAPVYAVFLFRRLAELVVTCVTLLARDKLSAWCGTMVLGASRRPRGILWIVSLKLKLRTPRARLTAGVSALLLQVPEIARAEGAAFQFVGCVWLHRECVSLRQCASSCPTLHFSIE